MQNALSLGEAMSIEDLSTKLVDEAEGVAKASGQILSVDDRRVLKDLFFLIKGVQTFDPFVKIHNIQDLGKKKIRARICAESTESINKYFRKGI